MHNGFIKIYRKLSDNPLWNKKPFSDGQAWVDLLMVANHKKGMIDKRGQRVIIERGQVGYSVKGLAGRWGWSRGKVERFLKYLESEHQIEQQKSNVTTLITLTNYETYNETDTKTGSRRAADEQQTDTNKNEKNEKKETCREIIDFFNSKTGKSYKHTTDATQQAVNGRLAEGYTVDDFKKVIDSKVSEWQGTEHEKYLTPSTLFRPSNFEKYLQNADGGSQDEYNVI